MSFFSSSFLVCSIMLFTIEAPAVAILSILSMFLMIFAGVILLLPPPPPPPFGSGSPPYSRLGALSGLIYSLFAISTLFSLGLSSGSKSSLSKMP